MTHKPPKPLDIDRALKHARWGMYVFSATLLLIGISNMRDLQLERERDAVTCPKDTPAPTPSLIDSMPPATDTTARSTDKSANRQREEPKP